MITTEKLQKHQFHPEKLNEYERLTGKEILSPNQSQIKKNVNPNLAALFIGSFFCVITPPV